eukprot:m.143446 g.143446  ORF g.143446 m.143446 type:complete len:361 (-) comp17697_c0_seq1:1148-2230(-)
MEVSNDATEDLPGTQELFPDSPQIHSANNDNSDSEPCGQLVLASSDEENIVDLPAREKKRQRRHNSKRYAANRKSTSVIAMHTTQLWSLLYEYLETNQFGDAAYVLSVLMPRAAYLSAEGSTTEAAIQACRAGIEVLSKTSSSRSYFSCVKLFNILQMFLKQKGIDLLQSLIDRAIYMVQHGKVLEATRLLNDAILYRKDPESVESTWGDSDFQNLSDSEAYTFDECSAGETQSEYNAEKMNYSNVPSAEDVKRFKESTGSRVLFGHSGMLEAALWESVTGMEYDTELAITVDAPVFHFLRPNRVTAAAKNRKSGYLHFSFLFVVTCSIKSSKMKVSCTSGGSKAAWQCACCNTCRTVVL